MNDSTAQPIIVMDALASGVNTILELACALPRNIPALILFVQHIGAHRSELSILVSAQGPNLALTVFVGSVLFELNDKRPVCYRCHIGHAFSLLSFTCRKKCPTQPCRPVCGCCRKRKPYCDGWRRPTRQPCQMSRGMRCARPTGFPTCAKRFSGSSNACPTFTQHGQRHD